MLICQVLLAIMIFISYKRKSKQLRFFEKTKTALIYICNYFFLFLQLATIKS